MSRTPEIFCLGCVPIVDNERTNAYVRWARTTGQFGPECCTFADFNACPLDSPTVPYSNPADDQVCWYDPDIPESADFLGLWIVDLDGLEDDGYNRGTSDIAGDGTVFGRPKRPGKVLTFDVMLLATSCCGMDYGYNWLVNVLKGQGCAHGSSRITSVCQTSEAKFRVCCPEEGMADDGLRYFPTIALTDGVKRADGERRDHCCCNYRRYTFVMQTGTTNAFGELQEICDSTLDPEQAQCKNWDECEIVPEPDDGCVDPLGCGDLYIDAFESPSLRDECYCPPYEQIRNCCCIDEFQVGSTSRTLVIDLFSGSKPTNAVFQRNGARNIEIVVFENPMGLPCPTTQEEYDYLRASFPFCARVTVGYVPPNSHLRIDGRTGEAYIVCTGRVIPVYDAVEGDLKRLDTGCNPLIVCALFDRFNSALPDDPETTSPSRMTVSTARRFG